ncbi:MAG: SRPBCC domain-containing protein [Archangium sp.]
MAENISVSDIIPASPERVYTAWLDAQQHGAMTGSGATDEGGRFTAWDGYISGRTVSAVPHSKIVQAWRTTEFPADATDSILTLHFAAEGEGTRLSITHENLPDGQGDSYAKGWDEFYFGPMKKHFSGATDFGDKVKETVEGALEEAKELGEATVKAVKKAQKEAAKTIKKVSAQVGKGAKALVARAKKAAKKVTARKPAAKKKKPAPKKKKAVAKKKKR